MKWIALLLLAGCSSIGGIMDASTYDNELVFRCEQYKAANMIPYPVPASVQECIDAGLM